MYSLNSQFNAVYLELDNPNDNWCSAPGQNDKVKYEMV